MGLRDGRFENTLYNFNLDSYGSAFLFNGCVTFGKTASPLWASSIK